MLFLRRGWDIHALSTNPDLDGGQGVAVPRMRQERRSISGYNLGSLRCLP
jgi:hypothetical protein